MVKLLTILAVLALALPATASATPTETNGPVTTTEVCKGEECETIEEWTSYTTTTEEWTTETETNLETTSTIASAPQKHRHHKPKHKRHHHKRINFDESS